LTNLPSVLLTIPGSVVAPSSFVDGPALWVNGKEILHRDADGPYDIRLTRSVIRSYRDRLRADSRIILRRSSSSDWIEVIGDDVSLVVELATLAVAAHIPKKGQTPV